MLCLQKSPKKFFYDLRTYGWDDGIKESLHTPRALFIKLSCFLYLEHQITTIDIFHHKKEPILKGQQNMDTVNF